MSLEYACKQCGNVTPGHFALSGDGRKSPLCLDDINKFISEQGLRSNTILPILAYEMVDTIADLGLYDDRIEEMETGRKKVDKLVEAEQDQFEKAVLALGKMKEDVVGTVGSDFDKVIQRLRNFHDTVVEELNSCRRTILTLRRDNITSRVTNEILYGSIPNQPNFYMELIQDVSDKLRKTIYSALILEYNNGEDFLMEVLKPDDFIMLGDELPVEHEDPRPAIRPVPVPNVTQTSTITPLPPPLPMRTKPAVEAPPKICSKCQAECKKQYHQCKELVLCLDCYERLIADQCYAKFAICPNCGRLPSELYDFREKKRCSLCKFRLKLTQIAHWCQGSENVICDPCYPKIYEKGMCKQCNQSIVAPPR